MGTPDPHLLRARMMLALRHLPETWPKFPGSRGDGVGSRINLPLNYTAAGEVWEDLAYLVERLNALEPEQEPPQETNGDPAPLPPRHPAPAPAGIALPLPAPEPILIGGHSRHIAG